MSDQKETSRYARRTITITGLMKGEPDPEAKRIMQEHGVVWDLSGKTDNIETVETVTKTTYIDGVELPSGFTAAERKWVLDLAEKHGIDVGIVEEEVSITPSPPYIKAPMLTRCSFESAANPDIGEWVNTEHISGKGCIADVTITGSRFISAIQIVIEGEYADHVNSQCANDYATSKITLIRKALKAAGYTESNLEIDCEVIMGAEREAKCDPDFMRSLLTTDKESEEE